MSLRERVEEVLDQVRPTLQADGGDITLLDVSEDGIVKVQLTGACGSCPFSTMTLKHGVEARLKDMIPEVKEVLSI
ncbi:MAG: NifU family protein [Deferribacterales bacterium]